jgi:hypothetical protein
MGTAYWYFFFSFNRLFPNPCEKAVTRSDNTNFCWQFQDQWITQGIEGGKRAAYTLRSAIAEICDDNGGDVEVMAKAVANINGLSRAMGREGTIQDGDMKEFALGFTQAKASFDFIDVGYGKERADSKIKGENTKLLTRP